MTASRDGLGSDLDKVDAYENKPADYDESPELTDADFARGKIEVGSIPVKRGRPAPNGAKQQVTMRLDQEVLGAMRNTGTGWQVRANDVLREAFLPRTMTQKGLPTQNAIEQVRTIEREDDRPQSMRSRWTGKK